MTNSIDLPTIENVPTGVLMFLRIREVNGMNLFGSLQRVIYLI